MKQRITSADIVRNRPLPMIEGYRLRKPDIEKAIRYCAESDFYAESLKSALKRVAAAQKTAIAERHTERKLRRGAGIMN